MIIEFKPIGVIHSSYKEPGGAPRQGASSEIISRIEIYEEFAGGLTDIDGFSHLLVLYYFHKSKGYRLMVKPPHDDKIHGVFATRSPHRPNGIGLCLVRLLSREGRFLTVKGLDAIEGTPLLDIKPYFPDLDLFENPQLGWTEGKLEPKAKP